jgi:flagellar motor switch/type III secretory pathway protein FliN
MSLSDHLTAVNNAIAEAWSTLFTKTASIGTNDAEDLSSFDSSLISGSWILAKIEFSGDEQGFCHYYFDQKQALTMVGMMMSMGVDDALIESTREGECGDEEMDGLQETFNQLSATFATVLRDNLDISLTAKLESVSKIDLETSIQNISEDDFIYGHSLELEGFDKEIFYQVIPKSLFNSGASSETDSQESTFSSPDDEPARDLESIKGISVSTDVILAERNMPLSELMKLSQNSIIEFWKPCDNPAELMIQDTVLANGEIVTADQHFGIRLLEVGPQRLGTFQKGT